MINFDYNIKEHNPSWLQMSDHSYRILIIGGSGSKEANALFNLISRQLEIDNIYLCAKDPYKAKHQFLINKPEGKGLKNFKVSKAFTEFSNHMSDIYENNEEYNPDKELKFLLLLLHKIILLYQKILC